MTLFSGYTESKKQTDARAWRIALRSIKYSTNLNTEAEADKIYSLICAAEAGDLLSFTDPRTPSQIDLDRWQAESEDTYKSMRSM